MSDLNLSSYYTRHEKRLRELITNADIPALRIKEAMLYMLFPGGKRFRPMLVYQCGHLLNTDLNSLDIIAISIELMHTFSLVHDDLPAMDNDDFRRGRPSCHRAFDEATAVLTGDGMQALAIDILLCELSKTLTASQVIAVAHELLQACGPAGMVSGQSLDMTDLSAPSIQESTLRHIHLLKTGKLILACVKMVIAASLPSSQTAATWQTEIDALQQFALYLGLIFQMQDDYLDRFGTEDILGKGRSSDIANQKQTFATLYNQPALANCIQQYVQMATQALAPFGKKSASLQALLTGLMPKYQQQISTL